VPAALLLIIITLILPNFLLPAMAQTAITDQQSTYLVNHPENLQQTNSTSVSNNNIFKSIQNKLANVQNSDWIITLIILIILLFFMLLIFLFIVLRKSSVYNQHVHLLNQYMLKLVEHSQQNAHQLQTLKENNLLGFEKNRAEINLATEKNLAEFNEKILKQLSKIHLSIVNSLNQSSHSQHQNFSEFQSKLSDTLETSFKRNTDSMNKMFSDLRQTTDQHMQSINERVEMRLKKGFEQTNQIFVDIKDRLKQIDQAQQKISDLSTNVISLQKTLDNKGARGAFGEVQLMDIVKDMIPDKYCLFQHKLSNDKRPDCIIILPEPTGKLIIDAKFPLENYKIMFDKNSLDNEKQIARSLFKRDIKKHIQDIAEKYIIPGETVNGAVMFIPSEAVFAEIHGHHPDLVQNAQLKQVWMASPTTLMALLTTARAVLADDERGRQAKIIHQHLNALGIEFNRFATRMDDLARHINQAHDDVNKINISRKKITDKFDQIEQTELDDLPVTATHKNIN
jgi:DNA recombination protein RmuC